MPALLETTTLGTRLALFAASAAVHVGVVVGMGGHAPSRATTSAAGLDVIEIAAPAIETPEAPVTPSPEAAPEPAHHHAHSHTHPYPVAADHDRTPHDPSIVHAPFAPAAPAMEAPAVAAAPETTPVRFTMSLGDAAHVASSAALHAHDDHDHDHDHDGAGDGPETVSDHGVDARPTLLHGDPPRYTDSAKTAGVEADVPVTILIETDGRVIDAHVQGHAGYGLDDEAVRAVRAYRFSRGARAGHPVRVRMTWTVAFRFD